QVAGGITEDESGGFLRGCQHPRRSLRGSPRISRLQAGEVQEAVQVAEARLAYLSAKDRLDLEGSHSLAEAIQACGLDPEEVIKLAGKVEIE
ncbi:MAG: hypothetical protein M1598_09680, partial [Actinobacteria bacterium]|nr:hypothetical protein [Actinomycetota bacterium]